ncbi:hypothetical protein F401_gp15 [Aeromonas phage phiAS7]|uniref:Uncharacterized protein n=1 Tax=Aeromonas phage phiAS7 TaxID=1141132 RepID=H6UK22_9CAUD|nr:hypothetical protein F401_gp15 [Aeromonas phage phiAS7]AEZ65040.1 hypothetical protein phiAS7_00015 [Aeromonas phage phiAS7]
MLKRNRKLNKQALIESSLMYGLCRVNVTKYRAFRELAGYHGPILAARMVADALARFPSSAASTDCNIWGFVVWGLTGYSAEWQEASATIPC